MGTYLLHFGYKLMAKESFMSDYKNKVQTAMVESAAKAMDVLGIM